MKKSQLKQIIRECYEEVMKESKASEQAHKLGLISKGWGRWYDKSGKFVAKTQGDKLVKVQSGQNQQKQKITKPQNKISNTKNRVAVRHQELQKIADKKGWDGMSYEEKNEFMYGPDWKNEVAKYQKMADDEKQRTSKPKKPSDFITRKKDGSFWIDREDIDTGDTVAKPGQKISFKHKGKVYNGTVSKTTGGRDDDVLRIIPDDEDEDINGMGEI